MRVGLVYDLFEDYPWQPGDPPDADVEFEPEETILAIEEALRRLGHQPVRIGTARALLQSIDRIDVDIAINIAEASGSRNREAYAPVLLEMAGIPFVGSDALTLSLSLDKALTKDVVSSAGVPTPPYRTYADASQLDTGELPAEFPLFVKPRYEGSAMGITAESRVDSLEALSRQVERITTQYGQEVIVEPFLEGAEFTVAVTGNDPPLALPVLQRALESGTGIGLHALDRRGLGRRDYEYYLGGSLDSTLESDLQDMSLRVYQKLECKDFARVDFRADAHGRAWFLEINPLPTFAPDGTFAIIAELAGSSYCEFLADLLDRAIKRIAAGYHGRDERQPFAK